MAGPDGGPGLTGCVVLGKVLDLSHPVFSPCKMGLIVVQCFEDIEITWHRMRAQ